MDCPPGKVPMWPPNGGQQPTYFLESRVEQKLLSGWTLEPVKPKSPPRRRAPATSAKTTTDKPEQEKQGTED